MKNILEISKGLGIPDDYIECYGKNKAKITEEYYDTIKDRPNAKLILMTSINPTPFGEGKTTQSIGLGMGLNRIGKKAIVVLREPSLGPVFGIKGGAIGGGKATVEPSEDINLHFTGDLHAIWYIQASMAHYRRGDISGIDHEWDLQSEGQDKL